MKNNRLIYILIIILAIWMGFMSRELFVAKKSNNESIINEYNVSGFSTDFTKVIEEVDSSIVTINADNTILSGFIYRQTDDNVYIITAYHGVASANSINVIFASSYSQSGELVDYDIYTDIAVIKVITPYQMKELKMSDSSVLRKGEFVISIGTPVSLDYASSVELGMISLKNVTVENSVTVDENRYSYYLNLIELSSDLLNGYSGSPVINMNGEFVGMNTMNVSSNFNFAVTSNEIKIIADKIINGDKPVRNNIGIKGEYISEMYNYEKTNLNIPIDTLEGIYVTKVKENSLAYEAGVRNGDIVTKINGKDIRDFNDYLNALYYSEGSEMTFEYTHNLDRMASGVNRD